MATRKIRTPVKLRDIEQREQELSELVMKSVRKITDAAVDMGDMQDPDSVNFMKALWRREVEEILVPAAVSQFVRASQETANATSHLTFPGLVASTVAPGALPNPEPLLNESEAAKNFARNIENPFFDVGDAYWGLTRLAISNGIADGLSIPNIAHNVNITIEDPDLSRATTIARTVAVSASNAGSIETMRNSGLVVRKEWIATHDSRTRPTHLSADGQIVDMDEPFSVGSASLDHPGDFGGPAGEVINCRCTMGYEVSDDEVQQEVTLIENVPPNEGQFAYDITEDALMRSGGATEEQQRVIDDYGGAAYRPINELFRWLKGRPPTRTLFNQWHKERTGSTSNPDDETADRFLARLKALDDLFDQVSPINEPIVVHRGVKDVDAVLGDQPWSDMVMRDNAFMSTSTDPEVPQRFLFGTGNAAVFKIVVPAGTKVINMKSAGKSQNIDESEILLDRGTKLKITGTRVVNEGTFDQYHVIEANIVG